MKIRPVVLIGFFLVALVLFGLFLPAQAAPASQGVQFATNTPLPDGRILYKVQPGDTCTRIGLLHGISVEQLRQLNIKINADCTNLIPGDLLLVGTGGPAGAPPATPGPSPTPLPPTITPTPFTGTTEICVLLFEDLNGDALRQTDEPVIVGGAISVTEANGKYSETRPTTAPDPAADYPGTCFTDVPEGNYNIAAAIPDNYNPTMKLNYTLDVKAGDKAFVDFGAQSKNTTPNQPSNDGGGGGTSPLLGFVGGLLLLGGVGLGWYALRMRNPRSKLQQSGLLRK
jgi:murein DD-endopeptidase MepM/ murein hydrolase activator NlpD